jgi:glycine/D-amino acid oxidase-like deaminating enzyme
MGQVVTQPFDQRPSAIMHGPRGVEQCPALTDLQAFEPETFAPPRPNVSAEGRFAYDDTLAQNRAGALVISGGIDGYGSLNPHISIASTAAMISTTMERYPDRVQLGVTGLWAGLLTDTPDQLPVVDMVGDSYVNAGHGWGIGSAPVCGEVIAQLIAGEVSDLSGALSADRPSLTATR